jgi:hypothetical protein
VGVVADLAAGRVGEPVAGTEAGQIADPPAVQPAGRLVVPVAGRVVVAAVADGRLGLERRQTP